MVIKTEPVVFPCLWIERDDVSVPVDAESHFPSGPGFHRECRRALGFIDVQDKIELPLTQDQPILRIPGQGRIHVRIPLEKGERVLLGDPRDRADRVLPFDGRKDAGRRENIPHGVQIHQKDAGAKRFIRRTLFQTHRSGETGFVSREILARGGIEPARRRSSGLPFLRFHDLPMFRSMSSSNLSATSSTVSVFMQG